MKKALFLSALCAVSLGAAARPAQTDTLDLYVIDGKKVENFDGSQLVGKSIKSYDVTTALPESGKKKVYRTHTITTAPGLFYFNGSGSGQKGPECLEKLKGTISGLDLEKLEEQLGNVMSGADFEKLEKALRKADRVLDSLRDEGALKDLQLPSDVMSAAPMFIVDGKETASVPGSLDPEDILSMTISKPGSKSAQAYGDKGKGGVVEIKTRSAEKDSSAPSPVIIVDGKEVSSVDLSAIDPQNIKSITVYKNPEDTKKYTDDPGRGVIVVVTKGN